MTYEEMRTRFAIGQMIAEEGDNQASVFELTRGMADDGSEVFAFINTKAGPKVERYEGPTLRMIAHQGLCSKLNEYSRPPWEHSPFRLWSLWDMLKFSAKKYVELGEAIRGSRINLFIDDLEKEEEKAIDPAAYGDFRQHLAEIAGICVDLGLKTAADLFKKYTKEEYIPKTEREYNILIDAMYSELGNVNFLFMPTHRSIYYDRALLLEVIAAFPSASEEISSAQKCYATGMFTASVFHCMRAVEIGVRTMGNALGVTFPFPTELAEWHNILDQIDSKIKGKQSGPRSAQKDEELRFYSEAAANFRYFKDGWRTRVAHARGSYEEDKALIVLDHTTSFFEILAGKLKE